MEVLGLTCNHCGAPLEVPSGTRFITCKYCSSRLEVHQTESAAYTEVVQALTEKTAEIADDLETIKLQNRLEQLDREWAMARERFVTRDKDGSVSEPSAVVSVVAGVVAIAMGTGWMVFTSSFFSFFSSVPDHMPGPGPDLFTLFSRIFPLFGLVFIGGGILAAVLGLSGASNYARKKSAYEAKRREVLERLKDA